MVKKFCEFQLDSNKRFKRFVRERISKFSNRIIISFLYIGDFKMIIAYVFGDLDLRDIERYSEKALGIRGYSGY